MTQGDVEVGVKVRALIDLPKASAGTVGIVRKVSQQRDWCFCVEWMWTNRPCASPYSVNFFTADLKDFEIVTDEEARAARRRHYETR